MSERGRIDAEVDDVVASWTFDPGFSPLTIDRMHAVLIRFARFVAAHGYDSLGGVDADVCERFVRAPVRSGQAPASQTMHFRRTTIRTTLRTMRAAGLEAPDPTLDIVLPPRGGVQLRPLTDDEIDLCRIASFAPGALATKRPAAWALAEATGTTADISATTTHDIAITATGDVTVRFGPSRTAKARTTTATAWGATILRRRLDEIPTGNRLCYDGHNPPGGGDAQAATSGMLGTVLRVTGLSRDPAVRPGSIRLWRIQREFDQTGSIEQAAKLAGARSLDTLAEQLRHDWTQP